MLVLTYFCVESIAVTIRPVGLAPALLYHMSRVRKLGRYTKMVDGSLSALLGMQRPLSPVCTDDDVVYSKQFQAIKSALKSEGQHPYKKVVPAQKRAAPETLLCGCEFETNEA